MKAFKLFILLFSLMIVSSVGFGGEEPIGKIDFILGKATVQLEGEKSVSKLKKNMLLYGGETIQTDKKAMVKVKLADNSLVQINENSVIIINKISTGENKYSFGVIKGGMNSTVTAKNDKKGYRVYTPTAVAGVRGTDFMVSVADNGKSNITVSEGAVEVKSDEETSMVKRGEEADVSTTEDGIKKGAAKKDKEKKYEEFQEQNSNISENDAEESMKRANEKMAEMQKKNAKRLAELKKKKKLSKAEQEELEDLYLQSINQGRGWYNLSANIFKKYKKNPLVKKNFYETQKSLSSIEDQVADMDSFIDAMSKEIDDFIEDVSSDMDDLEKNFNK
ncbi:MAG TPA: hypothetical protein DHW82_13550 [Spirochaetia bacterium]|nr:MAG: hypothetical protein A2Y41_09200 [Spirochaetes bacterium GWB1_36_13]HCL58014.1 hypothetical protein [Spirochaetia bacterium]